MRDQVNMTGYSIHSNFIGDDLHLEKVKLCFWKIKCISTVYQLGAGSKKVKKIFGRGALYLNCK